MGEVGSVRLVVSGPLAPWETEFRADLARRGYAPRSMRDLVCAMAGASLWLHQRGHEVSELAPEVVAELRRQVSGAGPVLRFLGGVGVLALPAAGGPVEALLVEFRAWLAGQRGLSALTVKCYGKHRPTQE